MRSTIRPSLLHPLFWCALLLASLCAPVRAEPPVLLVWGDSLSAGYGLDAGTGWVSLLDRRLEDEHLDYSVVNASVSGETSAGGLSRLPAALAQHRPAVVLIELGANDGLRGLPLPKMKDNLSRMIELSRGAHATPVLFAMQIPGNYGPVYAQQFARAFSAVADAKKVSLAPFFLEKIAADRQRWFQDDGLHPRAQAQPLMLDTVWPTLQSVLKK